MRREARYASALIATALSAMSFLDAQGPTAAEVQSIAEKAYIYAYPLVLIEVTHASMPTNHLGLIPVFRTEPSTIFVFRKVRNDVEEQAHRGADDRGGQADGSRPEG